MYSQNVLRALEDGQRVFIESLQSQTEEIAGLHSKTMDHNASEHKETRSAIISAVHQASREKRQRVFVNTDEHESLEQRKELEQQRKSQSERIILESLQYPHMGERYLRVEKAHKDTFRWIFNDPRPQDRPWNSFTDWLRCGKGIYWICGKAGSGKSTLMRFLYDHESTRKMLSSWSDTIRLDLAGFFFWNSGTAEQKSQIGLLRSLLHEILSRQRDLIPYVLPDQWRDEFVSPSAYLQEFNWSVETMIPAFERLAEQKNVRICVFIDGLDEYEGDPDGRFGGMLDLLAKISAYGNIKLCVSSRPWLVFEDAFEFTPKLRLQDLTFDDIENYVTDKLKMQARMKQLSAVKAKEADDLVQELVQKACGVFIWVKLVVGSLLDGLTNRDRISDLRIRLRALPSGIEELYSHMFQHHIPSIYHEQASRLFQIFRAAREHTYRKMEDVYLVTLAFADEEDDTASLETEIGPWSGEDLSLRCDEAKCRLKSRCGGLLEVFDDQVGPLDATIQYLHRTVRDFLERPDIWSMLLKRTECSRFSPKVALLQSYILQLKVVMMTYDGDRFEPVSSMVNTALLYAREAEDHDHSSQLSLLRELDKTATWHWKKTNEAEKWPDQHWAYKCLEEGINRQSLNPNTMWVPAPEDEDNFLSLAIKFGLKHYLEAELLENPRLVKEKLGRPLLDYVVEARCSPEVDIVSQLLKSGADPNQIYKGRTTWQHALAFTNECSKIPGPAVSLSWRKVYNQLIDAGANIFACYKVIGEKSISERAIDDKYFHAYLKSAPQWMFERADHEMIRIYSLLVSGSIGEATDAVRITSDYAQLDARDISLTLVDSSGVNNSTDEVAQPAKIQSWPGEYAQNRAPIIPGPRSMPLTSGLTMDVTRINAMEGITETDSPTLPGDQRTHCQSSSHSAMLEISSPQVFEPKTSNSASFTKMLKSIGKKKQESRRRFSKMSPVRGG
jgi:hypothetical protein